VRCFILTQDVEKICIYIHDQTSPGKWQWYRPTGARGHEIMFVWQKLPALCAWNFERVPYKFVLCLPCPHCQKFGEAGTCPRQLDGAGAYDSLTAPVESVCLINSSKLIQRYISIYLLLRAKL